MTLLHLNLFNKTWVLTFYHYGNKIKQFLVSLKHVSENLLKKENARMIKVAEFKSELKKED